jgi:RinA family phage transcriptional activator
MRREIRRFIESELRTYQETKKEWETIRLDIVTRSPVQDGQPKGSGKSVPTESKALQLITNKRLAQIERTVRACERVITDISRERFILLQHRYWTIPRTLTDDGIAELLGCDRRTFYRWLDDILTAIAIEMGLVD